MSTIATHKEKTTALILAFFFGGFGVHYFYLARPNLGVGRICASVFCIVPLIGWLTLVFVVLPWHIYDIIRIANGTLTPGDGSELR